MSALLSESLDASVARELWASFISLIRGYTAAHGLNGSRQAVLEVSEDRLLVRAGDRLLTVGFDGVRGSWQRETGAATAFTFDDHGRVVESNGPHGPGISEEMDIVAERLAREIMR